MFLFFFLIYVGM